MKNLIRFVLGCSLFFALVACDESSTEVVAIPSVNVSCDITACDGSINGLVVLIYYSKSGCSNDFEIVASSTPSLSCSGSGCVTTGSSWINDNGDPISEVLTGSYDLCALIDVDSSGSVSANAGDIIFEDSISISSDSTQVADGSGWQVVN